MYKTEKIYSVSELNQIARGLLESHLEDVQISGEISNLARPASGHIYFSLKDDAAQIRCALFKNRALRLKFKPENGQQVVVRGKVSLYVPRGDYQLIAEEIQPAGAGALQQAFDALKQKLQAEGLFDEAHKQALPLYPKSLAVITSPSGAAIRDVLSVLRRRYPLLPVSIYPVAVQGEGAAEQIVGAIDRATADKRCDVLLLTRGGGSLEDLWAFNEEIVARAVFACPLPIVCGVGHEIDFSIADFAADVRAPTPSAAAEIISPDGIELQNQFWQFEQYFAELQLRQVRDQQQRIDWLEQRLLQRHPRQILQQQAKQLDNMHRRLIANVKNLLLGKRSDLQAAENRLQQQSPASRLANLKTRFNYASRQLPGVLDKILKDKASQLQNSQRALEMISPLATLDRGYAIVTNEKQQVVMDTDQLKQDDTVTTRVAKGSFSSRVVRLKK